MKPFFSVVMPTFKRPERLKRAVESVLNQSFTDFEILIVNNANEEVIIPVQDVRITVLNEAKKRSKFCSK